MSGWDRPSVVVAAILYLALTLAIGLWSRRRTQTTRDFFIAGRRVGLVVTAMATMSAAFSGFVFLGGPGLTYRIGVASLMIVLPVGFTAGLLCWVVGERLHRLSDKHELFTIADAIHLRFASRGVTGLAAFAVLVGTIAYLGLQIQALGVVLQTVFDLPSLLSAMLIGMAILVFYSAIGGMVAGVYTDLVQGSLMAGVALLVFFRALAATGGWSSMLGSIEGSSAFGPAFLEPLGRVPAFTAFGFFFVFGIGVLGQPQMLHKFYMLRSRRKLRFLPLLLAGSQALCVLIWLGIGLAVPALEARGSLPPLAHPDEAAPLFLLHHAGGLLAGLTYAAILAAIMSTADSLVNIGSAAIVRDLPRSLGRPVSERLGPARIALLALSAVALLFAWLYHDLIALLGTFAFGTFGAALTPALAIGLIWRRVTAWAAGASIATGLVVNLGLEFLDKQSWFDRLPAAPLAPGVLPAAVSLAASFTVLFAATWIGAGAPRRAGTRELW